MPAYDDFDKSIIAKFEDIKEVITNIRKIRKDKNLPNKEKLSLLIKTNEDNFDISFNSVIQKLAILDSISFTSEKIEGAISFIVKSIEFYIPLGNLVDEKEELKKLEADLEYSKSFLQSVNKKLNNKKFVQNAPEKVVNIELNKKKDAEQKIKTLEERIESLK